jgi:Domain of unknown function (DUF4421)
MKGSVINHCLSGPAWVHISLLFLICPVFSLSAVAQQDKTRDHDSSYYASYREKLTARTYLSRKYTTLKMTPPDDIIPMMKYRPNTKLNLGIGATYRSLTLNIGVGIHSIHPNEERGDTKYLDLQAHFYARKWNFDLLGQFYHGYYMSPQGLGSADGKSFYVRPDLRVQIGGLATYRALNDRRFSYQAGLVQNEWQKKSAGSILVGGEAFYGAIHGDSILVPASIDSSYAQRGIDRIHFFEMGPGAGYAYTVVIKQHFFLLASFTINLDFRFSREMEIGHDADKLDITPNFIVHAGAGYNSQNWNLSVLWVANQTHVSGEASKYRYTLSTGNYRLIFAKRFTLNHKVKKVLQPINSLIEANP